jgi:hypothetical protein
MFFLSKTELRPNSKTYEYLIILNLDINKRLILCYYKINVIL